MVIEDSLGIAAELEADMQHVVDTYQCEWKTTLEDPEKLKRFRPFVNSDAVDPSIVFVPQRSQHRAAAGGEGRPGEGGNLMLAGAPARRPAASAASAVEAEGWVDVCALDDIVPDTGVCALVGRQAGRGVPGGPRREVYAAQNFDPFSKAFVLSRGIVGDRGGVPKVASPIFKQSFDLRTGLCLDDPAVSLRVYPARVRGGRVEVRLAPRRRTERGRVGSVAPARIDGDPQLRG